MRTFMPFHVAIDEAYPSRRFTHQSFHQRIEKGTLRVCYVPLFWGKPGYTVYCHLQWADGDSCAKRSIAASDTGKAHR